MFKVLIADDEVRVVKLLQSSIPWKQLGIELVEPAYNGISALESVKKNGVDIVLTDIRMPGLSGLDLCMELQNFNPNIQIIIISGYADFAYAQKAIQYGVLGYCLKPIEYAEIIAYIKMAARNLNKDIPASSDALLDSIEDGDEKTTRNLLDKMQLNASQLYVSASVGLPNCADALGADLALKMGKHKYVYLSTAPIAKNQAYRLITSQQAGAGIGLSTNEVTSSDLKRSISDNIIMAYHFFILGKPSVCDQIVNPPMTANLFSRISRAISLNDKTELKKILDEIIQINYTTMFNIKSAFKLFNLICSSNMLEQIIDKEDSYLYSFEQLACEYHSFLSMLNGMRSQLSGESVSNYSVSGTSNANFMSAIKYVNNNYTTDISLKSVADTLHMNPNYISQLFKKETGLTYTQYLTNLRISKAKQLLQNTELTINEVCEATGFNDYFYFLKTFKKNVGISPGKFLDSVAFDI